MNIYFRIHILALLTLIFIGCQNTGLSQEKEQIERIAPLLKGMGDFHYKVSTQDTLAQQFFDQGLILSYGFNHKEAHRSFKQAALLDSTLAMAYWGQALVLGPNINSAMNPDNNAEAWKKSQLAVKYADDATPGEKALIEALTHRYAQNPPEDGHSLDSAYAVAMGNVAREFPNDTEIQCLYAEAMMDLHPWDYWTIDQEKNPRPWTPQILKTLNQVIKIDSLHAGANHLYIHAIEASATPEKGLPHARRLEELVPGAGHLVHMPSHIYIRTGDYHEGTLANERAVKADNEYITQCRQQGIYVLGYVPHNSHFLWATATMEGRKKRSIDAARNTARLVDTTMMRKPGMGTLQHYRLIPLYSYVRFGQWDSILSYPKPAEDLIYPVGLWHYARGMAYTGKGELDKAARELELVQNAAMDERLKEVTIWEINTTQELMQIASLVLKGELEAKRGNFDKAIASLREAAEIERQLSYNEPPDWFFPVKHSLGAVLLEAGKPREAEQVYRNDLKKFPDNGWSLKGLQQSLIEQNKASEAAQIQKRFDEVWKYADIELDASRIMN